METNKRFIELKNIYQYVRKVCCQTGGQRYEGVLLDNNWQSFDDFVKDNWFRYYRAIIKWRCYKRVAPRNGQVGALKNNYVRLKRKVKERGFTKDNTVFTSPSDMMKYIEYTHKYMFENQLLGTRDIKNILKKRGIHLTMEMIVRRLKSGTDLFAPNSDDHTKWKGKFRGFVEIAKMEKVNYDILKKRFYEKGNIQKAIDAARNTEGLKRYEFEGKQLLQAEICDILANITGLKTQTLRNRFKKHGLNIDKLVVRKGYKGFSGTAKKVIAEKDGKEQIFNSIGDAAKELNLRNPLITGVLKGRISHTGGYKFRAVHP